MTTGFREKGGSVPSRVPHAVGYPSLVCLGACLAWLPATSVSCNGPPPPDTVGYVPVVAAGLGASAGTASLMDGTRPGSGLLITPRENGDLVVCVYGITDPAEQTEVVRVVSGIVAASHPPCRIVVEFYRRSRVVPGGNELDPRDRLSRHPVRGP